MTWQSDRGRRRMGHVTRLDNVHQLVHQQLTNRRRNGSGPSLSHAESSGELRRSGPRSSRSGMKVRYGPIPEGANRWLRNVFVQAVLPARELRVPIDPRHSCTRFRSRALIATTTVLADISTAPTAGVRRTPHAASTPAARGIAKTL